MNLHGIIAGGGAQGGAVSSPLSVAPGELGVDCLRAARARVGSTGALTTVVLPVVADDPNPSASRAVLREEWLQTAAATQSTSMSKPPFQLCISV
jgi:hypothetical protein